MSSSGCKTALDGIGEKFLNKNFTFSEYLSPDTLISNARCTFIHASNVFQEMMAVGMLDSKDVKKLFKQSCQMFPEGQDWDDERDLLSFIKAVTNKLKPLGMQLKKQISEDAHKKGQSKK